MSVSKLKRDLDVPMAALIAGLGVGSLLWVTGFKAESISILSESVLGFHYKPFSYAVLSTMIAIALVKALAPTADSTDPVDSKSGSRTESD
jgi:hypothetical protein